MRYAAALIEHRGGSTVFLLNVPSTWQTAAARQLYRSELERLGRFLEQQGGEKPTNAELTRVMLAHWSGTGPFFGQKPYFANKHLAENMDLSPSRSKGTVPFSLQRKLGQSLPLAILGGPLLANDDRFFEIVEQAGGRVALDATEDSERTMPRPFEPARTAADPFAELADAYFDGIIDAFRRPNSRLYDWLGRELAANHVRGIILRRYLWCDLWHAELQRLRQWSKLPVLEIDIGPDDTASPNRMQGRIEAFLETLQKIR
jgi:benzoyl-CoA reductase/2-hydroxyglutaryl-CoA dehydratase subunit BcrC/BadD/HgdB